MNQFDELVEDGHAAHDALLKIFTKKIKRSKKKDEGASLQIMADSNVCKFSVWAWRPCRILFSST